MATTLIDTRKSIMGQIHESWNQFRSTDEAMVLMFGECGSNYRDYHEIPLAKDFAEKDAPWTSKQTVLERNTVHANKLIRLYIALNIDVEHRMPIWQFFEISSGIVGKIKEQTNLLKRIQRVLKLEQQLKIHLLLPNATSLFTHTGNLSLESIEGDFKEYPEKEKRIKELKKRNAALRRAKKEQKRKDDAKKKKREEKKVVAWIQATKHSKRDMLKMWKAMEKDGYTIKDVIEELERQLD